MNPLGGHRRRSRRFWALTAFVLAVGLLPRSAGAEVRRICKVSYETQAGWSQEVAVEVRFATGRELNRATKSSNYKILSRCALIRFVNNGSRSWNRREHFSVSMMPSTTTISCGCSACLASRRFGR
jgi:hypothetical protein